MVITGIGVLTPVGCGVASFWAGLRLGQSAVRRITRFDASAFPSKLAAEIDGFEPLDFVSAKRARRLDRYSQFCVAASRQAVEDAGLKPDKLPAAGCYIGSALGGVAFAEQQHDAFLKAGAHGVNPSLALSVFGGAGPANVAIELGMRGPSLANANSCASGAIAIGEAYRLIKSGQQHVMLAGGAETPLAPLTFGSFALIKAMSTAEVAPAQASRPFDANRDGFVMGEGAAMLVLESLEHAENRGASVYAEVRGYAMTNDACDMLAPLPDGAEAARAMCLAMAEAEVCSSEVDYINAHASSTPIGDRAEVRAIERALGPASQRAAVSGTKGLYGHPLGASGAIETAICALALQRGWLPGTTNLARPDPDNMLCLLGAGGRTAQPKVVLNNAFGFGGINAALVLAAA